MDFSKDYVFVSAALIAYAVIFLVFFPQTFASIDEHAFLKNAVMLKDGQLFEKSPELACRASGYSAGNGYYSGKPIGKSVFLLPFTVFGLSVVMLSGLLIHIANALLIFLILRRLSIDGRFTILYIFFPAMVWESRTLYSELLVLTFFLAGLYFYVRGSKSGSILSGFMFGLAAVVRYDAFAGFVAFAAPLAVFDRKNLLGMAAGFAPAAIFLLSFNAFMYGDPLSIGSTSGAALASSLPEAASTAWLANFIFYAFMLLVPFLVLLVPIFIKDREFFLQLLLPIKDRILLPIKDRVFFLQLLLLTAAYLVFNAYFTDFFAFTLSWGNTFTLRLRYLVPLIGVLLIPYSYVLDRLLQKYSHVLDSTSQKFFKSRATDVFFSVAAFVLVLGALYASSVHNGFLDERAQTMRQIQSTVPQGSLMVGSSDDCIYSITPGLGRVKYINVNPPFDLGGQSSKIGLEGYLEKGAYLVELTYSRLGGNSGVRRQDVIDSERKAMHSFIEKNRGSLVQVFRTDSPNMLTIYKWAAS